MSDVLEKMKTDDKLFMKYIDYNAAYWNPVIPVQDYR